MGAALSESIGSGADQQQGAPVKHERLHALDALRAFAMMLGVWLHAAMPYTEGLPPFFWATMEERKSSLISISVMLIHSWRMEVFFLLSGLFTAMLVVRRGVGATARHRFKRIVLPLVLALLLIQPICAALWGLGYSVQWGTPASTSITTMLKSSWGISVGNVPGEFGRLWHLWFLYVLVYFIGAGLLMHKLTAPLVRTKAALSAAAGWCTASWFGVFLLALPTALMLMINNEPNGPSPMSGLRPVLSTLLYYALPFFFGWFLFASRNAIGTLASRCWWPLVIALSVAFPAHLYAMTRIYRPENFGENGELDSGLLLLACASRGLLTAGASLGLIGIFTKLLSNPKGRIACWIRFGSDSAYWVYLVHLPLVVAISIAMLKVRWIPELEMLLIVLVSMIMLLVSYRYIVRYSPIGTLLNGKRERAIPWRSDP